MFPGLIGTGLQPVALAEKPRCAWISYYSCCCGRIFCGSNLRNKEGFLWLRVWRDTPDRVEGKAGSNVRWHRKSENIKGGSLVLQELLAAFPLCSVWPCSAWGGMACFQEESSLHRWPHLKTRAVKLKMEGNHRSCHCPGLGINQEPLDVLCRVPDILK